MPPKAGAKAAGKKGQKKLEEDELVRKRDSDAVRTRDARN
jgi:hypothetical protein